MNFSFIGSEWLHHISNEKYTVAEVVNVDRDPGSLHCLYVIYTSDSGKRWCKSMIDFVNTMVPLSDTQSQFANPPLPYFALCLYILNANSRTTADKSDILKRFLEKFKNKLKHRYGARFEVSIDDKNNIDRHIIDVIEVNEGGLVTDRKVRICCTPHNKRFWIDANFPISLDLQGLTCIHLGPKGPSSHVGPTGVQSSDEVPASTVDLYRVIEHGYDIQKGTLVTIASNTLLNASSAVFTEAYPESDLPKYANIYLKSVEPVPPGTWHVHDSLIRKWLDNPNCKVYMMHNGVWEIIKGELLWSPDIEYRVEL
jgi:hypothetical protein